MLSCVWLFATPWTVACQALLSMGFPRQEYCSGLPVLPPGESSHPGIESMSLVFFALAGRFFTPMPNHFSPVRPCATHRRQPTRLPCPFTPISSVQSLSRVWLFATPWIAARQASLSITNSWSLLKLMPIESVMPSSHLIFCPLLPLHPSQHQGLFQFTPIPPGNFSVFLLFARALTLHGEW